MIKSLFSRPKPEQVVREHGPQVMKQLRRIFGPSADVDDAFQAVFVEVIRSLPAFRGRSKLKTWIYRITLNVAHQEMRLKYRRGVLTSLDDLSQEPECPELGTEDLVAKSESRRLVYQGLTAIDPKKRMALVLHDIEGHSLREISEELGRPLQTVASQVRKGRIELAEWIAERLEAPRRTTSERKEEQQ